MQLESCSFELELLVLVVGVKALVLIENASDLSQVLVVVCVDLLLSRLLNGRGRNPKGPSHHAYNLAGRRCGGVRLGFTSG